MPKINQKQAFGIAWGALLVIVTAAATVQVMSAIGKKEVQSVLEKRDEELQKYRSRVELEIRSLEEQLEDRNAHITVLEGEFVFGGITPEEYSEKEQRLQRLYQDRRDSILRARTLPILTAQIDKLRPKYKNSQWEKGKIPDLPESRLMAHWFYETGKEVNVNPMVLIAVAWVESRFRPDICHGLKHSEAGAIGCMQIMPFHVSRFDFIRDVKELATNMEANIRAGGYILREYLDHRYAGEAQNQLEAALRLYNYGPRNYGSRMKKKAKFNNYAESVIEKAEAIFDEVDPLREKFGPENDPAKFLIDPLALNEIPAIEIPEGNGENH